MSHAEIAVKVWGEYALFTRPEFKSERVSYQVITPSAARGLLEARRRRRDPRRVPQARQ